MGEIVHDIMFINISAALLGIYAALTCVLFTKTRISARYFIHRFGKNQFTRHLVSKCGEVNILKINCFFCANN